MPSTSNLLIDSNKIKANMKDERRKIFRAYLAAFQLLECLEQTHKGCEVTMLDVGGGHGIHARFFRKKGLNVDIVDIKAGDSPLVFEGDYLNYESKPYDVIWSSHVLEHVSNIGFFVDKLFKDIKEGGYLGITVPPIRENRMAYAHLSLWNAGLLLLNLAKAGFDPRTAHLATYGYNISCVIQKTSESNNHNSQWIKDNFPPKMKISNIHFSGDIKRYHWSTNLNYVLEHDSNFVKDDKALYYYDDEKKVSYACR